MNNQGSGFMNTSIKETLHTQVHGLINMHTGIPFVGVLLLPVLFPKVING